MQQAQTDAAIARAEVEQLKKAQPSKKPAQDAELADKTIRAQRRRAIQLRADSNKNLTNRQLGMQ